jgi:O-methyltransferase domain
MNCSGASREILKTESTIKTASRRRPFSPASPVPICDQCCASSIRSVIQHGKSLRTRCEQAMARRNSANSISANRRFSRGWRGILLRPGRGRVGDNYDFGRHHKVLDVAGGTGSFLVAVLKGHANLRGTLFELPGPCAVARQKLANLPEGSRIDIVEGDVFKDALPADHDALIVANTAHVFSVPHNIELMRARCGQACSRAVARHFLTIQSPASLIGSGVLSVRGLGSLYRSGRSPDWLKFKNPDAPAVKREAEEDWGR